MHNFLRNIATTLRLYPKLEITVDPLMSDIFYSELYSIFIIICLVSKVQSRKFSEHSVCRRQGYTVEVFVFTCWALLEGDCRSY